MTDISVDAVRDYLADAGWFRTDRTWHGAAIWSNGAEEVLVPPRDGMGDSAARQRELLLTLEHIESRPAGEIARDIAHPLLDVAVYWAPALAGPDGSVPLPSGLGALQGVHDMFRTAASTVLAAPRFPSGTDRAVLDLLSGIHLGTTTARQIGWAFLVPLAEGADPPLGRQVLIQMYDATLAVRQALTEAQPEVDPSTSTGVTPEFCSALSTLAGEGLEQPFELTFRWGRGVPSELPDQSVAFPAGAGEAIQDIALRLEPQRQRPAAAAVSDLSGPAMITGLVEALHDNPRGTDRRRVKVRGELLAGEGPPVRRTIWIRLPDDAAYEIALSAHSSRSRIEISGTWTSSAKNVRMLADHDGVRVVDEQDPL
jgi:hypothetical protein